MMPLGQMRMKGKEIIPGQGLINKIIHLMILARLKFSSSEKLVILFAFIE